MVPEFGLNSWTTGEGSSALSDAAAAEAAGYQWLELTQPKIERHLGEGGRLADLAGRDGLGILSVSTLEQATLPGPAAANAGERCRTLCRYAQSLGAATVIVGPTYLPPGQAANTHEIRDRTAEALGCFAGIAAGFGVRIGFEFHGYAAASVNTLASAVACLDALGDRRVGLVVDAFHFFAGGSDLRHLAALDPERLLIVHLADADHADPASLGKSNRILPGLGVWPVRDFVHAVRQSGYAGAYSLELFRPEYWALPAQEVARRGLAAMRDVVGVPASAP